MPRYLLRLTDSLHSYYTLENLLNRTPSRLFRKHSAMLHLMHDYTYIIHNNPPMFIARKSFMLLGELMWHKMKKRPQSLKRHDQFVAFYFYCKIMLISINYNYCSVLTTNKCLLKQNWLRNVKRQMFIRIPTLSLKSQRVTPTLWPLPTGSRAPG